MSGTVDEAYVLQLRRELDEVKKLLEKNVREYGRWEADHLTNKRSFQSLPKYSGKAEDWDDFHFQLKCFLRAEEGWDQVLESLDKLEKIPSSEDMVKYAEYAEGNILGIDYAQNFLDMSKQLYQCLCMKLSGNALRGARNMEDDKWAGIKCFVKMKLEVSSMTGQRVQGIADKVYSPKRATKYADVVAAIDLWEVARKELERHEGKRLHDSSAIHGLKQIVPVELEKDITKSTTLKGYEEVKAYVIEQVAMRRDTKASGPTAMECDMLTKSINALMNDQSGGDEELTQKDESHKEALCQPCGGGQEGTEEENPLVKAVMSIMRNYGGAGDKGGGKGGQGKGRFDGNCSHCGKYGHRLRECWEKDKAMEEYRASKGKSKGKGYEPKGKGKGGWYGGWSNKGKGKGYGKGVNHLGWDDWGQQGGSGAWTLSLAKAEDEWMTQKKPGKGAQIAGPPGLTRSKGFEKVTMFDALKEGGDDEETQEGADEREFPVLGAIQETSRAKMPRMPNYSKGKMRKGPEWKPKMKECHIFMKAAGQKELNPFIAPKPDEGGWVRVKGVMDSGASESVAPPGLCPHYKVLPSPGSIAGQNYVSAGEEVIPNLGEQYLNILTDGGTEGVAKYQVADVVRPLNSVSEICDAGGPQGQTVVFGRNGGYVWNHDTGKYTEFSREDGVYTLEFWVKPPGSEAGGFQRQG